MPYIPPDVVAKAREMDLLTYLQNYEPNELVHFGGNTYCTREHDSLKISNGKWYWFSRGIGGYNALDYLIKVKEIPFMEAVETIMGRTTVQQPIRASAAPKKEPPKVLLLPHTNPNTDRVISYLAGRGIDREIIRLCIQTGRLYESYPHHNVVFVGLDKYNKVRYGNLRGCGTDYKGEATGSDKRFSFSIPAPGSDTLHLFEGAVDLLSYATIRKQEEKVWNGEHQLSLAGVYKPRERLADTALPLALKQYLSDHPEIRRICLRLDQDATGRLATRTLIALLKDSYMLGDCPPSSGKDYNDSLCMQLNIPITRVKRKVCER